MAIIGMPSSITYLLDETQIASMGMPKPEIRVDLTISCRNPCDERRINWEIIASASPR